MREKVLNLESLCYLFMETKFFAIVWSEGMDIGFVAIEFFNDFSGYLFGIFAF